jgi:hypothetical protein
MRVLALTLALLAAVAGFVVAVDPYGTFFLVETAWNRYKPDILTHWRTGKTLRVALVEPETLLVGSSRVLGGLDPDHPTLAGARAFNFGLPGTTYCDFANHLRQIAPRGHLRRVVIGLDIFGANAYFEQPGCALPPELANAALAFPRVLLSIDTVTDARRTITRRHDLDPNIWQPTPNGLAAIDPRTVEKQGGPNATFRHFEQLTLANSYFPLPLCTFGLEDPQSGRFPLRWLERLLADAYEKGMEVTLVINPEHARMTEALVAAGLWTEYERWYREIVAINARLAQAAGRPPFPIWDFGGFNSVTTEPVPPADQRTGRMRNYWDASHYTKEVGDLMLERAFGSGAGVPADFGVRVTPENVAARLAAIAAARDAWAAAHPADVADVRAEVTAIRARPGCSAR